MFKKTFRRLLKKVSEKFNTELNQRRLKATALYQELVLRNDNQIRAMQREFASLLATNDPVSKFKINERKFYSQNGEDGLILYIFSKIDAPCKTFIEFGIEDGTECNSANLAINFGWKGLLIDGEPHLVEKAKKFYHTRHKISPERVKIVSEFLTTENINRVFVENGFSGEIDLLSIDIDGNDYWIWQSITSIQPRLVVIEYNASFGNDRAITIKYEPDFDRYKKHPSGWYHGASLKALVKLAHQKGYILAGCDSAGANAFFVRKDVAQDKIQEIPPEQAFYPSAPRLRIASQEEQFKAIAHLGFVEV